MTYRADAGARVTGDEVSGTLAPMTRSQRFLVLATFVPAIAFAHPGHAEHSSFATGFLHPFSGADHLLALAAVGMLAGRLEIRPMAALLGAWMCLLTGGMVAAMAGIELPAVRPLLVVSIGVSAVLAFVVPKSPSRGMVGGIVALASFFAFFHGFAHGERALETSSGLTFMVGIAAASALVLALAAGIARYVRPAITAGAAR
jgi:urease accessory protein